MGVPVFNSDNEMWTEINTMLDSVDDASNLTAYEQARLQAINAKSNWTNRDINDVCRLLHATMTRQTGGSD